MVKSPTIVFLKRGKLQIEKALENMDWNTAKFEKELAIFTNTQPERVQYRLWKQYVEWMQGCGVPLELVEVVEPTREEKVREWKERRERRKKKGLNQQTDSSFNRNSVSS